MLTVHVVTYGVLILRSMPRMEQGLPDTGSQLTVLLPGNTGPGPFQERLDPGKEERAVAIVPPEVSPLESIWAPVGTVAHPNELFNARNDSQLTVSRSEEHTSELQSL